MQVLRPENLQKAHEYVKDAWKSHKNGELGNVPIHIFEVQSGKGTEISKFAK